MKIETFKEKKKQYKDDKSLYRVFLYTTLLESEDVLDLIEKAKKFGQFKMEFGFELAKLEDEYKLVLAEVKVEIEKLSVEEKESSILVDKV